MTSLKSKVSSSDEFWITIERIYGEIPPLIRLILQVNGFNSFLALKGIRYDDKQEFFQSLEGTVFEVINSDCESHEKTELENEMAAMNQTVHNFRLRPGHRNYIMNLMGEIEKFDVNEFFGRCKEESKESEASEVVEPSANYTISHTPASNVIVRRSSDKKIIIPVDHVYSRDDQEDQEADHEYVIEEEYLSDNTMDSMSGIIKLEYSSVGSENETVKRKASTSSSSTRRRPDIMYNDEFIAKGVHPRRRRVTLNKSYPDTEEGTKERFGDLIQQSIECILSREKQLEIENVEIIVEKENENSYAVYCPLCHSRIRLPVVRENQGRYCNYKRSNFERHLRFKHCKGHNKSDQFEQFEEIVTD